MTPLKDLLDEIDEFEKVASAWPWWLGRLDNGSCTGTIYSGSVNDGGTVISTGSDLSDEDLELIFRLRNSWPQLRAAIVDLMEERDRYKAALEDLISCDGYGDPGHMKMAIDCCEIQRITKEALGKGENDGK